MFWFNGDYSDLTQVAPFLPEFEARLRQLEKDGKYRYNDDFKGLIPGIVNTLQRGPNVGTHEEAAIYLLQKLEKKCRDDEKVWALLAKGYTWAKRMDAGTHKFGRIVLVDGEEYKGGWAEFTDARLVMRENEREPFAVLPKGKRTNGSYINGRRVLVLP